MKPLPTVITAIGAQDMLAKALSSLLIFIDNTAVNTNNHPHVDNVISLAKKCKLSHPALVASVFSRLDKRLKRIGSKRLVWFLAHLSIQAARSLRDRDREVGEAEARALICGTSWAFQRLHKIGKARVDADEAYSLAQGMRLDRTLAFCLKCLGRLCRMEAEGMSDGEERRSKIQESKSLLFEAIEKFGQLAEFGPDDPEVGDCYSLLGRTFLLERDLQSAEDAIRKAYVLIVDETSKDYVDLTILNGDFEVARGDRSGASRFYERALQIPTGSDPELSEMRARAFFQLAMNQEALANIVGARTAYQSAKDIWDSLQDEEFAAKATWRMICLSYSLSKNSLEVLAREPDVRVRVETVDMHNRTLQQGQTGTARRSEPPVGYWRDLIKQATERLALRGQRSETEW
jgi:tetratricopeptide (TPR) repeat protein